MSESATADPNVQVSHTDERGRTLSGMGTSVDQLTETMERHAPEPSEPAKGTAPAPDAGKPVGEAPAPEPKLTRGAQRFSDLTKERDAAQAERDAIKAERETLARERDELKARLEQPAKASVGVEERTIKDPLAGAKPAASETFDFPDYETYLEAHPELLSLPQPDAAYNAWRRAELLAFSDWKDARTDLDGRIRKTLDDERAARTINETVERTRAKGREVYADFDTVLRTGPGAGVHLGPTQEQGAARCALIFNHPQSEHLQYAIMKDGDLAKKLGAMDDISFGMALAALVPNGHSAAQRRAAQPPPPAPYQPVNGNSATTQTPSSELAGKGFDFDKSGYREKRAAERKAAGRH